MGDWVQFVKSVGGVVRDAAGSAAEWCSSSTYREEMDSIPTRTEPWDRLALTAGQLVTEFLTELIESLLVVFLLAQTKLTKFKGW